MLKMQKKILWQNWKNIYETGKVKVNKSVYIAKLRQRYHLILNNILLHVSNHTLKDMYILNYGTFLKIVSIIVPSRC